MSTRARRLVDDVTAHLAPLERDLGAAWWDAATDATAANADRRAGLDRRRRTLLADPDLLAEVRAARAEPVDDPLLARSLDRLADLVVPHQVPGDLRDALVELETRVDALFTAHRAEIDGVAVDDNALGAVLRTSADGEERRIAWEASKQVGATVASDVRALARLRNRAAALLGYRDHFALALATSELDEDRLLATLDEVDRLTRDPFRRWKADLDRRLADAFGIARSDLAPWHLDDPFFQDPPLAATVDLDPWFAELDLVDATCRTFAGLGLDVGPVVDRSDLHPRPGKSQHAFCIDVDRADDVRVLANLERTERWADTMLHEFGHAVYDLGIDPAVPWLLREPAHACTTEGVAMLCGRLARDPEWLTRIAGVPAAVVGSLVPRLRDARRAALLVFVRWVLVVTHFERRLYADPDGDLDAWWWDLVERYQLVRRPPARVAPDWAAKIHLAVVPVYYQNYLYGELFASQVGRHVRERFGGFVDRPDAGAWLGTSVFAPGASRRWDRLVRDATGRPLGAAALAADLR